MDALVHELPRFSRSRVLITSVDDVHLSVGDGRGDVETHGEDVEYELEVVDWIEVCPTLSRATVDLK